jgi:antitoxin (DNA-binding transcriptional repressor) of toxin-antitoxin stability system
LALIIKAFFQSSLRGLCVSASLRRNELNSRYLDQVEAGETLIICRYNVPIAEVRPIKPKAKPARVFGLHDGFGVSPEFFEDLPEDELRLWNGEDDD